MKRPRLRLRQSQQHLRQRRQLRHRLPTAVNARACWNRLRSAKFFGSSGVPSIELTNKSPSLPPWWRAFRYRCAVGACDTASGQSRRSELRVHRARRCKYSSRPVPQLQLFAQCIRSGLRRPVLLACCRRSPTRPMIRQPRYGNKIYAGDFPYSPTVQPGFWVHAIHDSG